MKSRATRLATAVQTIAGAVEDIDAIKAEIEERRDGCSDGSAKYAAFDECADTIEDALGDIAGGVQTLEAVEFPQ